MAEPKAFVIRIDGRVLEAMKRWAEDELRSLNGQIEYVLRQALRTEGRLTLPSRPEPVEEGPAPGEEAG